MSRTKYRYNHHALIHSDCGCVCVFKSETLATLLFSALSQLHEGWQYVQYSLPWEFTNDYYTFVTAFGFEFAIPNGNKSKIKSSGRLHQVAISCSLLCSRFPDFQGLVSYYDDPAHRSEEIPV